MNHIQNRENETGVSQNGDGNSCFLIFYALVFSPDTDFLFSGSICVVLGVTSAGLKRRFPDMPTVFQVKRLLACDHVTNFRLGYISR